MRAGLAIKQEAEAWMRAVTPQHSAGIRQASLHRTRVQQRISPTGDLIGINTDKMFENLGDGSDRRCAPVT
ncbi:hypothetical protein EYF80_036006 [Liparis tanakae]|uniref:Uncharacterized protein n=1 Tax=Liparis tanakae TaxID=230148 RepID=A0A4Z2GMB5_9TELE|nr:hypothetical protein EYF80_036006 [Liparis tanakae]